MGLIEKTKKFFGILGGSEMHYISDIKDWYISKKGSIKDRRIIRHYNSLQDKLNRLAKKGEPGYYVKGYSKALNEFRSLVDIYLPAIRRESARLEEFNGYKISKEAV